jgi:hypothetical protein
MARVLVETGTVRAVVAVEDEAATRVVEARAVA